MSLSIRNKIWKKNLRCDFKSLHFSTLLHCFNNIEYFCLVWDVWWSGMSSFLWYSIGLVLVSVQTLTNNIIFCYLSDLNLSSVQGLTGNQAYSWIQSETSQITWFSAILFRGWTVRCETLISLSYYRKLNFSNKQVFSQSITYKYPDQKIKYFIVRRVWLFWNEFLFDNTKVRRKRRNK